MAAHPRETFNINLTSNDEAEIIFSYFFQLDISVARRSVTANFCLQSVPAAIWVFAINYLKYWNYHKYRGAAAYLLAATFHCIALLTYLSHRPLLHGGKTVFYWRQKLNKNLTKFGRPLAIQCSGDHEIKLSKVSQLIITENVRSMQKVRICRISFCCKIRCYFCRNSMPVDGVDAFQSLFICFRNQNLICLQLNHKRSCKLNV